MNYYDGNKIFILNLKRKRKDKNVQGSGWCHIQRK